MDCRFKMEPRPVMHEGDNGVACSTIVPLSDKLRGAAAPSLDCDFLLFNYCNPTFHLGSCEDRGRRVAEGHAEPPGCTGATPNPNPNPNLRASRLRCGHPGGVSSMALVMASASTRMTS